MKYDFVIIGGGFYGCAIALYLRRLGYEKILIVEREPNLLARASYCNQARVHNGYHYPRSFLTAYRSRINLPRFCRDYGFAVKTDFVQLYAIAAKRSKVTPNQFERFMQDIGASYERGNSDYQKLFDPNLIAEVYVTEEYAFDSIKLRDHFMRELPAAGCQMLLNAEVGKIQGNGENIFVSVATAEGEKKLTASMVLNCAYARINHNVQQNKLLTPIKHEITEIALVEPPEALAHLGVTVMDGPYFSMMPFPAEKCHSFSHVRYTPHSFFIDEDGERNPIQELQNSELNTRINYMLADAVRYMPSLKALKYRHSLFDIKTILLRNESDDGRPIFVRRETIHPNVFSVLGGKIDNIYEMYQQLDSMLGS